MASFAYTWIWLQGLCFYSKLSYDFKSIRNIFFFSFLCFGFEAAGVITSPCTPHALACKEKPKKENNWRPLDGIILNTLLLWFHANFRSWVGDADVDGPDATGPSPRWEWATRFSSSARAINIWRSHLRFYQTLVVALKRKRHFKL